MLRLFFVAPAVPWVWVLGYGAGSVSHCLAVLVIALALALVAGRTSLRAAGAAQARPPAGGGACPLSFPAPRPGDRRRRPCGVPRGGEAARIEPGEQPHQQPVARHALLRNQIALLPDLLGAAIYGAIEGESGESPDRELVRRVPGRGEGRRAGAQPVGRVRGQAGGGAGEMDRAGFGEIAEE